MSYDNDHRHGSFLGSLIHAVIELVFWFYFLKFLFIAVIFLFKIFIKSSKFIVKCMMSFAKFMYCLTRKYINDTKPNVHQTDAAITKISSDSLKNTYKNPFSNYAPRVHIETNVNRNFANEKSTTDFRAKYPFVMFDIHPIQQTQFITECEWLQNKTGYFPSEADQQAILRSLGKVSQ